MLSFQSCTGWGLQDGQVARAAGELLPRLSILTRPKPGGISLLHFPWSRLRRTLSGTLALWSSDFPHTVKAACGHLSYSPMVLKRRDAFANELFFLLGDVEDPAAVLTFHQAVAAGDLAYHHRRQAHTAAAALGVFHGGHGDGMVGFYSSVTLEQGGVYLSLTLLHHGLGRVDFRLGCGDGWLYFRK